MRTSAPLRFAPSFLDKSLDSRVCPSRIDRLGCPGVPSGRKETRESRSGNSLELWTGSSTGAGPMQYCLDESIEEMALRAEDRQWVTDRIQEIVHPQGWKKALRLLREWGLVGVVIMPFLALLGIVVTLGIFTSSRLEQNARFQARTEDFEKHTEARLAKIEAALLSHEASQSPSKVLKDLSEAHPDTFSAAIPALKKVTELAPSKVPVANETLQSIAEKLRETPQSTPEYWPTVLQFIKFASAGFSPNVPPAGPPSLVLSHVYTNYPRGIRLPTVRNQVVLLDGGELWNARFENCRIIFTDNPLIMHNFTFVNCVFEMPISTQPSPYLKRTAQILLASNFHAVSIPLLQ
jgi:hypothetical protein